MIAFPRSFAKTFRAVLRQSAGPSDYSRNPIIVARSSIKGVSLECVLSETAVRLEYPGRQTKEVLVFPAPILAQVEGKGDDLVTLEEVSPGKGHASWTDAGTPAGRDFDTVAPDKHLFFPPLPDDMRSPGAGFRNAMFEAACSASSQAAPRTLHKIQLRGSTGQIVGTDGRQLLLQGGFSFPWRNAFLVSAITAWGHRELVDHEDATIGQSETHLFVRLGPWRFALKMDAESCFPAVEQVVPSPHGSRTQLQLGAEDIVLLCKELLRLSTRKDDPVKIKLLIDNGVVVRPLLDDQKLASDLKLNSSEATGRPVEVVVSHHNLLRALKLGFTRLEIVQASTPVCCRDEKRVFVWMPLTDEKPRPVQSEQPSSPADSNISPEKEQPTMPDNNGKHTGNGNGEAVQPTLYDPLADAEAVKALLMDATARINRLISALKHHRKQAKAVRAAVDSLRQLPPLAP